GMASKNPRPHCGNDGAVSFARLAGGNSGVSTCTYGMFFGTTVIGPSCVSSCSQRTLAKQPLNSGYIQSRQPVMVLLYLFSQTPSVWPRNRFFQARYGPSPSQRFDFTRFSG